MTTQIKTDHLYKYRNTASRRAFLSALLCAATLPRYARAANPETITIMTFGDSLFHGFGLAPAQSMSSVLGNWFTANGWPVTIINASVSGDTTAGGKNRIDWTLGNDPDAYPDLVLVELGANDMLRGTPPSETRANLDAILSAITSRNIPVFLVGIQALSNFGKDYKAAFDPIYPTLAERYNTGYHPYIYRGFRGLSPFELAGHLQSDGLHPNAKGVARLINDIAPDVAAYMRTLGFTPS